MESVAYPVPGVCFRQSRQAFLCAGQSTTDPGQPRQPVRILNARTGLGPGETLSACHLSTRKRFCHGQQNLTIAAGVSNVSCWILLRGAGAVAKFTLLSDSWSTTLVLQPLARHSLTGAPRQRNVLKISGQQQLRCGHGS